MRRIVTGPRLAIRVDEDTLLAVPPMDPSTPSAVRVKVFEYVLRRQPGLAQMIAEFAHDAQNERRKVLGVTADMLSELPYGQQFARQFGGAA